MSDQETLSQVLLKLLSDIGFSKRYYNFYERCQQRCEGNGSRKAFEDAVTSSSFDFKYSKKERVFSHTGKYAQCELVFKIAFLYSQIEFILYVKTSDGYIGGPFPMLAREMEEMMDPNFEYTPLSPKIPFCNLDEAREIVSWGISLFEEARSAILSYEGWNV